MQGLDDVKKKNVKLQIYASIGFMSFPQSQQDQTIQG